MTWVGHDFLSITNVEIMIKVCLGTDQDHPKVLFKIFHSINLSGHLEASLFTHCLCGQI